MRPLDEAPDTLQSIFPECKTLEEKAIMFLELKDSGASFRAMSRSIGVHHQTVSKLYKFLQDTQLYADYMWEKNEQVKDFLSKDFFATIHEEYKTQRTLLNRKIKKCVESDNDMNLIVWLREKRLLLKDMVTTAINLTPADKRAGLGKDLEVPTKTPSDEDTDFTQAVETFAETHKVEPPTQQ